MQRFDQILLKYALFVDKRNILHLFVLENYLSFWSFSLLFLIQVFFLHVILVFSDLNWKSKDAYFKQIVDLWFCAM